MVAIHNISSSSILHRILPITIHANKKSITEYALLDEVSRPTIVDKSVLGEFGLHGEKSEFCVRWSDSSLRPENNSEKVNLKI